MICAPFGIFWLLKYSEFCDTICLQGRDEKRVPAGSAGNRVPDRRLTPAMTPIKGGILPIRSDFKSLRKKDYTYFYRISSNVGLSMMCYKVRKRKEDIFRREPVKRTHGKIVVLTLADS